MSKVFYTSCMKTNLSVNINKVALLRNARIGNLPDLYQFAKDCEEFGADGITVHPRPDERHIRYSDIPILRKINTTEFNIEGNPIPEFLELVLSNPPDQCTLVPDSPGVLTSDQGWDTIKNKSFLQEVTEKLHSKNIRVSIFLDADPNMIEPLQDIGVDRIELYTGDYAKNVHDEKELNKHIKTAELAHQAGLKVNAGHDLNLKNLKHYKRHMPYLVEVSIGHALISDALYNGIKNTISMYKNLINS